MYFVHKVVYENLDELKSLADGTEIELRDNGTAYYADKAGSYEKVADGLKSIYDEEVLLWEDIDEVDLFISYDVYTDLSDGIYNDYDFIKSDGKE